MGHYVKKALWYLLLAFLLFYLFTRPESSAHAIKMVFAGFRAIGRFFSALAA